MKDYQADRFLAAFERLVAAAERGASSYEAFVANAKPAQAAAAQASEKEAENSEYTKQVLEQFKGLMPIIFQGAVDRFRDDDQEGMGQVLRMVRPDQRSAEEEPSLAQLQREHVERLFVESIRHDKESLDHRKETLYRLETGGGSPFLIGSVRHEIERLQESIALMEGRLRDLQLALGDADERTEESAAGESEEGSTVSTTSSGDSTDPSIETTGE